VEGLCNTGFSFCEPLVQENGSLEVVRMEINGNEGVILRRACNFRP